MDDVPVDAVGDREHQVVDQARLSGEHLGGGQRREDAGKGGLRHEHLAFGRHGEVFGGGGLAGVGQFSTPAHRNGSAVGQLVELGEVALHQHDRAPGVLFREQPAGEGVVAVDLRSATAEDRSGDLSPYQHGLRRRGGVHLGGHDEALLGGPYPLLVGEGVGCGSQGTLFDEAAGGQIHPKVVHGQPSIAGGVGDAAPFRGRGQAGVTAGADGDDEGDR